MSNSSNGNLIFLWLSKNRIWVLIGSILIGAVSALYNFNLIQIPISGIFLFFFPSIIKDRDSKAPYYNQILRFYLFCFSISMGLFSYMLLEEIIRKRAFVEPFEKMSPVFIIIPIFLLVFLPMSLFMGYLWKRILKFNRIHLRILVNQYSLLVISLSIFLIIMFVDSKNESKNDLHWWQIILIPCLILIPWVVHMLGRYREARRRDQTFSKFIYEYEKLRFEAPLELRGMQMQSRKYSIAFILIPSTILYTYHHLTINDYLKVAIGVIIFLALINVFFKEKWNNPK